MNRRDAGHAVMGMMGALAGAGCASPQSSEALPSNPKQSLLTPSSTCTDKPIFYQEFIHVHGSAFRARFRVLSGAYTVTSSDPSIVVHVNPWGLGPNVFDVHGLPLPHGDVTVVDTASGASLTCNFTFFTPC